MKKRPLTILVVIPYGFNDRLTNFVEFVVSRLLARSGWKVLGLARCERGEQLVSTAHGIEVHRYRNFWEGAVRICVLFLRYRPDVVHIHTLRNNRVGVLAAMLAKLMRIPLAFTETGLLHDHYLIEDRDDPLGKPVSFGNVVSNLKTLVHASVKEPRSFAFKLKSYIFHWGLTHADTAVFYSKHNLPIAQKLGIRKVIYLPQILDESRWGPPPAETLRVKGEAENLYAALAPCALFVGQTKLRKGWDILLRAIPYVPESVVKTFIMVTPSSRSEINEFTELVDKLRIRHRILFLGQISNNLLRKAFGLCIVVIVPSRYEGFGLVPLEAFEMERPVVASRVPALTDFLVHEQNAFLVPPKDPESLAEGITSVATDMSLYGRLVAGGNETLSIMRSKKYHAQWLEFYENLRITAKTNTGKSHPQSL